MLILTAALLVVIAGGCETQQAPAIPPQIIAFTVSPTSINSGAKASLLWNVTGAASVSIFPGIGQVDPAGVMEISPTSSTVYTLSAENAAGTSKQTASITVTTVSLPVINSFTATPSTIAGGQSSNLQWNVTGASSVNIDQGVGKVDPSATATVKPSVSTTYTLSASNSAGNVSKSVTVSITVATPPVINNFAASPDSVAPGDISTLSWDVSGANSVSISPGLGSVNATGSRVVHPMANITYTLTATNGSGPTSATAVIKVSNAANEAPTVNTFIASSSNISSGGSATLSWNVTNATTVSIDQNIGTVAATGTQSVSPTATTTYTLTATNANGSKLATTTVNVGNMTGNPPTIASFTATPSTVTAGEQVILRYEFSGQLPSTIDIEPEVGTPANPFEQPQVYPQKTTTYTLTATNAFGSTTATVIVTVTPQ